MFRPDRIGTPIIHSSSFVTSTANVTIGSAANNSATWPFNVVNASPVADFGRSMLLWNGTEAIPAGEKIALVQQVTITQPLAGDVTGIELNGSLVVSAPINSLIVPIFAKLSAAVSGVLTAGTTLDEPTMCGDPAIGSWGTTGTTFRAHRYQTQLIHNAANVDIAGTYIHGFCIYDNQLAGYTLTHINACLSVRQLNDQQNVNYRDTLR